MGTPTSPGLHITVATTPDAAMTVQGDIRLLKAALLYGDSVTLCSAHVSWYLAQQDVIELSDDERLDFLLQPDTSDLNEQELADARRIIEEYRRLKAKRDVTPQERMLVAAFGREIEAMWRTNTADTQREAKAAGMDKLAPALGSGLVRVHRYPANDQQMMDEALRVLCEAVILPDTFPLIDAGAAVLVQAAITDDLIKPSGVQTKHGRSSMLSADILQRLPYFEAATFDEVLAIRRELERPLVRFRAAVLGYAGEMQAAPWDPDFRVEAADLFMQHVRPAVLELEEAAKSNSFVRRLASKVVTGANLVTPTGLSLAASFVNSFAHFANNLVALGGAFAAANAGQFAGSCPFSVTAVDTLRRGVTGAGAAEGRMPDRTSGV